MIYYLTHCPHCNANAAFTPEVLECDNAIVGNCNYCQEHISQTFTLKTFEKWWKRFDEGETKVKPFIEKEHIEKLRAIEEEIKSYSKLDIVEIHFKDFNDYYPTERK